MKTKLLFLLTCIFVLTLSVSAKSSAVVKTIPDEPPLPVIVVTVPWSVDTLRIECASDIPPIIMPTVSSSCGMDDTSRSISTTFGACINERTIVRTWYFTDLCGDDTLVRQVIIVLDTIPPVVTRTWAEDTSYLDCLSEVPPVQYPTVTDNCGIKDTTRSIQTTFGACNNERTIKRTWIFRDSCDNEGRIVQMIYVKDSIPPIVTRTWAEDTSYLDCLSEVPPVQYPTVTDNCGIKDTTRSIQTTFGACNNERTIKRTWIFRDSCDNEGRIVQMIYVKDSIPPIVTRTWAEDTSYLDCLSEVPPVQYPTVTDNCGIKDTTRSIQTTFGACNNERTIKRTWIFRDSCDNEGRIVQMIYVKDSIPPIVTRTWAEDTSYLDCLSEVPPVQYPTVTDNCGIKDTTRSIQTTFGACNNERTIKRTWIFRDSCDNEGRIVQMIYVKDSIPPIVTRTWAEDTSYLDCLSEVPPILYPTVTDNCGIKDTTRSIETHFGACMNDRTIRRTWIFRDSCDNEGRIVQMIYVQDTIPPDVIVPWTEDTVRIECASAIPAISEPTSVSDNCGVRDTTFTRTVSDSTCINHLTIEWVWEYSDSCDNATVVRQLIIINDDIPPLTLCHDTILELDEFGTASIVPEDLDDGTTDNCGFNLSASQLVFTCSDVGENMITLTATDSCNNEASCISLVTVEDNLFPIVVADNMVIFLDENGYASITVADVLVSATDNCGILDISLSMTEFTCEELGYNTVELIVTDINGNTTVTEIIVAVFDSMPPVLVMNDIDLYLDEYGNASIEIEDIVADSYDNCEIVSLTIDQHDFDCSHIGDNVVYAHAIDIAGNASHAWATVSVIDDMEPVIVCIADTTIEIPEGQNHYVVVGDGFDPLDMYDNCDIIVDSNDFNGEATLDGAEFPVGTTTVTWLAEDQSGNIGECDFDVTITVATAISDHLLRKVRIYPNPTNSELKIDMGRTFNKVSLIIKDMNGKVMRQHEFELTREIDLNLEGYVNGVYFITIIGDKQLGNYRVIKY